MRKKFKFVFRKKPIIATLAIVALTAIITPTLAACAGPIEGLNAENIINLVFPNLWVFIGQIISMLILFTAIIFLVWKPTNKMIQRRKDLILSEIEQATKDKELAALELENAKKLNLEASKKAQDLIADANLEGYKIREEATKQAQHEANRLITNANHEISREFAKVQQNLDQQVIEIAIKTAESLMQKNITKVDEDKAIKEFIESIKN